MNYLLTLRNVTEIIMMMDDGKMVNHVDEIFFKSLQNLIKNKKLYENSVQ